MFLLALYACLHVYIYIDASVSRFFYIDLLWRIYIFMRYIQLDVFTWFAFGLKEVLKHKDI